LSSNFLDGVAKFEDNDFLNLEGVKFDKIDTKSKIMPKFRFVEKISSKLKFKHTKKNTKTKVGQEIPEAYKPKEGEAPKEIIPKPSDLFTF